MKEIKIKCNHCGLEIAKIKIVKNKKVLKVNKGGMPINVINKELDQAELICPNCSKVSPFDLGMIRKNTK